MDIEALLKSEASPEDIDNLHQDWEEDARQRLLVVILSVATPPSSSNEKEVLLTDSIGSCSQPVENNNTMVKMNKDIERHIS